MHQRKMDEELDCGIRVAFKIFGGKWKLCIIDAIHRGIVRPVDIYKSIPNAKLRVIKMQLAELLFYDVVEKCAENTFPKKSEYRLTSFGHTILPVLAQIDNWGSRYSDFVIQRQKEMLETA